MKLPAAIHPGNHLAVQCLLLHAALGADNAGMPQQLLFQAARELACSHTICDWDRRDTVREAIRLAKNRRGALLSSCAMLDSRGDKFPDGTFLAPDVGTNAMRHLGDNEVPSAISSTNLTNREGKTTVQEHPVAECDIELSTTDPARLVALHAPSVLLPRSKRRIHDVITYDAAVHHASLLSSLLSPYGFHVALTGLMRRGCPSSLHAEYILCLSEAATREVEAVNPDSGESSVKPDDAAEAGFASKSSITPVGAVAECGVQELLTSKGTEVGATPLTAPRETHPVPVILRRALRLVPQVAQSSTSSVAATPLESTNTAKPSREMAAALGTREDRMLGGPYRLRACTLQDAFSTTPSVSAAVTYRTRRALQKLHLCGYVVAAARAPFLPSASSFKMFQGIPVSVRYDPQNPTKVPPTACTDPAVLRRLQLHSLTFHLCPWYSFATRQFFLTGPQCFTAHTILSAVARGVELNGNGAFLSASHSVSGGVCCTGVTSKGADVTGSTAANSPINSGESVQGAGSGGETVTQLLLESEKDILTVAGLPFIDPLLRGLYCQRRAKQL